MSRHRKRVSTACWADRWPLERALFAMAGTMTAVSAALAITVSKWFALIAAFVALNQWLYVAIGACGASLMLSRFVGLRSGFDPAARIDDTLHEGAVTPRGVIAP